MEEYAVSVDYGTANPCSFGLWGLRGGRLVPDGGILLRIQAYRRTAHRPGVCGGDGPADGGAGHRSGGGGPLRRQLHHRPAPGGIPGGQGQQRRTLRHPDHRQPVEERSAADLPGGARTVCGRWPCTAGTRAAADGTAPERRTTTPWTTCGTSPPRWPPRRRAAAGSPWAAWSGGRASRCRRWAEGEGFFLFPKWGLLSCHACANAWRRCAQIRPSQGRAGEKNFFPRIAAILFNGSRASRPGPGLLFVRTKSNQKHARREKPFRWGFSPVTPSSTTTQRGGARPPLESPA